MLVLKTPGGSEAGLSSALEKSSRSRWYCATASWNRAIAALISASVGAPLAGAAVTLAGSVTRGVGAFATADAMAAGSVDVLDLLPAALASPATGSTACGWAAGSVGVVAVVRVGRVGPAGPEDPHPATASIMARTRSA